MAEDSKGIQLPEELLETIISGRCILFVGAGASRDCGAPTAAELAKTLADLYLDGRHRDEPLSKVAAFIEHKPGLGRRVLIKSVVESLSGLQPSRAHKKLVQHPWAAVFTTNYDMLIERAYERWHPTVNVNKVLRSAELSVACEEHIAKGPLIVKLHGCISNAYSEEVPLVISEDDYPVAARNRAALLRAFEMHKYTHMFLFVGYAFGDPDLSRIWRDVNSELGRLAQWAYAVWPGASDEERMLWRTRNVELIDTTFSGFVAALSPPARTIEGSRTELRKSVSRRQFDNLRTPDLKRVADVATARILIAEADVHRGFVQASVDLEGLIAALSSATQVRDPYSYGHQQRVADLAPAIGAEMGVEEHRLVGIHVAGMIHDVGKIYVPAEIFCKPVLLNKAEFSLIKIHPQAGYELLREVDFPWPVAQVVLQHHERMDGSGYPQGLKGSDILIEAKILGVAEVIDAMLSPRPYRPPYTLDDALHELQTGRGGLYDKEVVDAALRLLS